MDNLAPGNVTEMSTDTLDAWKSELDRLFSLGVGAAKEVAPSHGRSWFFNSVTEGEAGAARLDVAWTAYPKLRSSTEADFTSTDENRSRQEEYCEWAVRREGGAPVEMVFTTETPDYYRFLHQEDPNLLLELYHRFVGDHVTLDDLTGADGGYNVTNRHNVPPSGAEHGPIVHMGGNGANYYIAAIALAARATWPSVDDNGNLITDEQSLINCRGFGEAHRHSDPFIGAQVNQQVRLGNNVSLGGPRGLYIDSVNFAEISVPSGFDPVDLFTIERGDDIHIMRLRIAVPNAAGFSLDEVKVKGQQLKFGSQIAEIMRIRLLALARQDVTAAPSVPCNGGGGLGALLPPGADAVPSRRS